MNFNATHEERVIIRKIAERAKKEFGNCSTIDIQMDIEATHCNGCPLKLEELLNSDTFNFRHDIAGINNSICRETGTL